MVKVGESWGVGTKLIFQRWSISRKEKKGRHFSPICLGSFNFSYESALNVVSLLLAPHWVLLCTAMGLLFYLSLVL